MTLPVPDAVTADLAALSIALDPAALDRLADYLGHLLEVNRTMNLTAVREPEPAWQRLIVDSLTVLPGLEPLAAGARVADVGSGGGLPGIPIAIARPDLRVALIESTQKKARFLEACRERLGLTNLLVEPRRAEAVGHDPAHRQQYDAVVSRAIGAMPYLLECSMPLAKIGGRVLAMKGPRVEQELEDAGEALATLGAGELGVFDAYPESFGNSLVIVSVLKDRATPARFPRDPSVAKHSPL